jgi:hypothetical protein
MDFRMVRLCSSNQQCQKQGVNKNYHVDFDTISGSRGDIMTAIDDILLNIWTVFSIMLKWTNLLVTI